MKNLRGEILTVAAIGILILTSIASIATVSYIRSNRTATSTRASGVCEMTVPGCVYGSYMENAGCEQICGAGNCRKCRIGTTCKYECVDQGGGGRGGGGNGSGSGSYSYPKCSGYSANTKSACENELKTSCTQCSNDGKTVRWHAGSSTSSQTGKDDPVNKNCRIMNCQNLALPAGLTKIDKAIYEAKDNPGKYYSSSNGNCTGAAMSQNSLVSFCTKSPEDENNTLTNNCTLPGTTTKLTENETRCHTDKFNYTCTRTDKTLSLKKGTACGGNTGGGDSPMPPTNGHCAPGTIGTNADGSNQYAEKVPCSLECTAECGNGKAYVTSTNAKSGPCCYKTALNSCTSAPAMCLNTTLRYTYPQTSVLEQTINTAVQTVSGQIIDCSQLTCIIL